MSWKLEGFDVEQIAKENMPMFKWGSQEYGVMIRGIKVGADAMLKAIWKMAKESPTGTFVFDTNTIDIYEEQ